ncbi:hypothetical protein SELMODRAFT_431055 [Selaginella moellendorffii]|uniref:Uncharacterized protein n=1 Tax=Selaginella moellendorffii TaxID=88036 RepID=D8TBH0_SELML|nr:hypothetical protein SELMODRAFT_431055 [Selaginella moellendorffii]
MLEGQQEHRFLSRCLLLQIIFSKSENKSVIFPCYGELDHPSNEQTSFSQEPDIWFAETGEEDAVTTARLTYVSLSPLRVTHWQWSLGISSVAAFSWFWDFAQKQAERKTETRACLPAVGRKPCRQGWQTATLILSSEKPVDRSANKQDTGKDCCARCSRCCSTHLRRREDEEDEPLTKGSFWPRLRESWAKKPKEAKFLSELWTIRGKFESLWERPRTTVASCIAYAARNPPSKTVNCPLASLGELLRLFKWIDSNSLLAHIPSEARFYATRRDIPPKDLNEREEKREEHPTKNKEQLTKHFVVPLKVFTLATWYL